MRGLGLSVALAALAMGASVAMSVATAQQPGAVRTAYTVEPFTPPSTITINGTGVRLRAEPFANQQTAVLSTGSTGLPLNVIGIARMPDWTWYQVILRNGQKAFIRSDLTSAPSRGGGETLAGGVTPPPPLPPITIQPSPPRVSPPVSASLPPAPVPPAYQPPAYQPPVYQPPPVPAVAPQPTPGYAAPPSPVVGAPAQPVQPAPVQVAPAPTPAYVPPVAPVQPAPAQPARPDTFGGAPISLVPKPVDPVPGAAAPTGASGLQSQPPQR
jgi:hypothetical protein